MSVNHSRRSDLIRSAGSTSRLAALTRLPRWLLKELARRMGASSAVQLVDAVLDVLDLIADSRESEVQGGGRGHDTAASRRPQARRPLALLPDAVISIEPLEAVEAEPELREPEPMAAEAPELDEVALRAALEDLFEELPPDPPPRANPTPVTAELAAHDLEGWLEVAGIVAELGEADAEEERQLGHETVTRLVAELTRAEPAIKSETPALGLAEQAEGLSPGAEVDSFVDDLIAGWMSTIGVDTALAATTLFPGELEATEEEHEELTPAAEAELTAEPEAAPAAEPEPVSSDVSGPVTVPPAAAGAEAEAILDELIAGWITAAALESATAAAVLHAAPIPGPEAEELVEAEQQSLEVLAQPAEPETNDALVIELPLDEDATDDDSRAILTAIEEAEACVLEVTLDDLISGWIAAAAVETLTAGLLPVEVLPVEEEFVGPPEPPVMEAAAPVEEEFVGPPEPPPAPAPEPPAIEAAPVEPAPVPAILCLPRRPQARVRPGQLRARRPIVQPVLPAVAAPISAPEPAAEPGSAWQRRPDRSRSPSALLVAAPVAPLQPPSALAHLATYARMQGLSVEVLDLNLDLYRSLGPSWQALWDAEAEGCWTDPQSFRVLLGLLSPHLSAYASLLASHPARLLAFTVSGSRQACTLELAARVKALAPDKRVLLGGPSCVTPERRRALLSSSRVPLDGFALGEGEQLLCDAIAAMADDLDLHQVPGVLACHDGTELPYARRKRLLPLDRVPFPRYEDFDLRRYPGTPELTVEWSRGCIGACTFCQEKAIDGRYRSHSALAIVSSLRRYAHDLGVRRFQVCDPLLNGDALILGEVCRRVLSERLEVEWRGQVVPTRTLTSELLRTMRKAGCTELRIGVESAADPVLYRMNKRRLFSSAEAGEVIRCAHGAGIRTALSFMVGFPGEGEKELQRTCDFIRENARSIDELSSVSTLQLLPETPLFLQAGGYGIRIPDDAGPGAWISDGNTPEVRRDRAQRLVALVRDLGIPVRSTEIYEPEAAPLDGARVVGWSSASPAPELLGRLLGSAPLDEGTRPPQPSA